MKISICTQLLDWNFGLKEALPTWLNYPCDEIVIFDWGNGKESAKEIVDLYQDNRIKFAQGLEKIPYNKSVAHNVSVRLATGDLIFGIDADVKIIDLNMKFQNNCFIQGCRFVGDINSINLSDNDEMSDRIYQYYFMDKKLGLYNNSLAGTFICWRKHYDQINGFDERLHGWGGSDTDFFDRLGSSRVIRVDFPLNSLQHINHDNKKRVENLNIKSLSESNRINRRITNTSLWGKNFQQRKLKVKIFKNEIVTI